MMRGLLRSLALLPVVDRVRAQAEDFVYTVEQRVEEAVDRAQRKMVRALSGALLMAAAVGLAVASLIVFLSRFFPVDAVLIGMALLFGYIALLIRLKR